MTLALEYTVMEMLIMSGATLCGIFLAIYLASRRRPSINRASDASLRRMYARGAIDAGTYDKELARRRRGRP